MLFVVRQRSLRRADHSSRKVLPAGLCLERDRESSTLRRPWPIGGCCDMVKKPLDKSMSDAGFRCFYLKSPGF